MIKKLFKFVYPWVKKLALFFINIFADDISDYLKDKFNVFIHKKEISLDNLIITSKQNLDKYSDYASVNERSLDQLFVYKGKLIKKLDEEKTAANLTAYIEEQKNKAKYEVWGEVLSELNKQKGLLGKEQKVLIDEIDLSKKMMSDKAESISPDEVEKLLDKDETLAKNIEEAISEAIKKK
jgi:hypothetical protein